MYFPLHIFELGYTDIVLPRLASFVDALSVRDATRPRSQQHHRLQLLG